MDHVSRDRLHHDRLCQSLLHSAPKPSELPAPGYPVDLVVTLKNTKSTEYRLRALIVRDGELMDTSISEARYNSAEEPYYKLTLKAPLGELVYQFILVNQVGNLSVSERYSVRRACIPSVTAAPEGIDPALRGAQRISALESLSKGLERDIIRYQGSWSSCSS